MTSILSHIDAALKEKGLKDASASRLAVGNPSLIKNIRAGGGNVGYDSLGKLADVLGLELYFGPIRDTGPVNPVSLSPDGYALIPLHEAELSAGPGMQNHNSEVIDHLAFRRGWLRRLGVSASTACLAHVRGDSMLPTLRPGDMVLIDRSRTEPAVRKFRQRDTRRSTIFALVEDGEARVKRIERPVADTMILLSDNPEFPPELRTGHQAEQLQLSIIGKVVWWGHTVED